MKQLLSFHGKPSIKNIYIDRVRAHQEADRIIQGTYWEDGKGCAVGCTIEGSEHDRYETELGIPKWLAHLEDTIFEGLENNKAKKFPLKFLKSIRTGSDLSLVRPKFLHWILSEGIDKNNYKGFPEVKKSINTIIKLLSRECNGQQVKEETWSAARSAAESAARSARSAARSAWSARSAESAAESAESAAWSARSAESAAWSAESAWSARSAAESARSAARSAWSARSAARSAAWSRMADKLIELLRKAP